MLHEIHGSILNVTSVPIIPYKDDPWPKLKVTNKLNILLWCSNCFR